MSDGDNITKLVIMVIGVSAIAFFAYLIYKESNKSQTQTLSMDQFSRIERRIAKLEYSKPKEIESMGELSEKNVVSMSDMLKPKRLEYSLTPADYNRRLKRTFGMS